MKSSGRSELGKFGPGRAQSRSKHESHHGRKGNKMNLHELIPAQYGVPVACLIIGVFIGGFAAGVWEMFWDWLFDKYCFKLDIW